MNEDMRAEVAIRMRRNRIRMDRALAAVNSWGYVIWDDDDQDEDAAFDVEDCII